MKIDYSSNNDLFHFENIYILSVNRPQDHMVSYRNGREFNAFFYTLRGKMRYYLTDSDKEIIAETGKLAFLPAGTCHTSTYMEKENEIIIVQFALADGKLPERLSAPCLFDFEWCESYFRTLHKELQNGSEKRYSYYCYKLYEMIWNVEFTKAAIPYKFRKIQQAVDEIRLNYAQKHKISYYASLCSISESGFRKLFCEYTGMSPIEYRNRIRLQEARNLLRYGEYSVAEVSDMTGFENISFFCRSYKKMFGHSPGHDV